VNLIVGVDPGTTVAYAVLDVQGNIHALRSSKQYDLGKLIRELLDYGTPLIIASDKKTTPFFVQQVATKFGAKVFFQKEDLLKQQKLIMTRTQKLHNDHERDALAAAMTAFAAYRNVFEKIDSECKKRNKMEFAERIKRLMVLHDVSFDQAIKSFEEKIVVAPKKKRQKHYFEKKEIPNELAALKEQNQHLKEQLRKIRKFLEKQSSAPDTRYWFLQKEIQQKNKQIEQLTHDYETLKSFFSNTNHRIVKKLKNLGEQELKKLHEQDELFLVEHPDVLNEKFKEMLRSKIIIAQEKVHHDLVSVPAELVVIKEIDGFAIVDMKKVQEQLQAKKLLSNIVREYQEKRLKQSTIRDTEQP